MYSRAWHTGEHEDVLTKAPLHDLQYSCLAAKTRPRRKEYIEKDLI